MVKKGIIYTCKYFWR